MAEIGWIKLLLWPLLLSNALRLGWLVCAAQSGRDPNALGADPIAYLIGALVVLHYVWLVKADLFWPIVFAVVYAVLMLLRWWPAARRRVAPVARTA